MVFPLCATERHSLDPSRGSDSSPHLLGPITLCGLGQSPLLCPSWRSLLRHKGVGGDDRSAHSLFLPRGPCGIGEPRNRSYFTIIDVCCCSRQWGIARSPEIGIAECLKVLCPCPVTGIGKFGKRPASSQQANFPPSHWGPGKHHLEPLGTGTVVGSWEQVAAL